MAAKWPAGNDTFQSLCMEIPPFLELGNSVEGVQPRG